MICCRYFRELLLQNCNSSNSLSTKYCANEQRISADRKFKVVSYAKETVPSGISETDSAVTQNVECAEEFEILVACQGVEASEELEEKKG